MDERQTTTYGREGMRGWHGLLVPALVDVNVGKEEHGVLMVQYRMKIPYSPPRIQAVHD